MYVKHDKPVKLKVHKKKHSAIEGSNIIAAFTCALGTNQKQTEERHRVVEFTGYEGKTVRVVTNLREVTAKEIVGIYKERWAIE